MLYKVELVEGIKGGRKEGTKIANNNEQYHIGVGTSHTKHSENC
jgi:hypothetical protein